MHRIAVIGNSGGGKTRLSRKLSQLHALPLVHVDSIQFMAGMKIRPHPESIAELSKLQAGEKWIVDGYGPLDILVSRLELAEMIVFIDLPIWRHAWWLAKRQLLNIFSPRQELAAGCSELSVEHTIKLFKTLKNVHRQMRPEMLKILNKENCKHKVVFVRTLKDWNQIFNQGL
jgi:adenylate kinase family enzyme